jgi:MFS family permease
MASGSKAAALDARQLEASPYAVLRNRNFVLYLTGRFIASFGEQMLIVAVGWQLYERTHSALALGMVGLMNIIPMFSFTLLAGHIADSFDRKRVITLGLAGMACAVAGLTVASWSNAPVFWIYACIFLMGTARTFMWPSSSAFLPQLVGRADFPKAVTWNSGSFHLSSVAGPAAGGAVIALTHSATPVYFLETIAAICCVTLILFVHVERTVPTRMPLTLKNLAVGFSFVFSNPVILGIITLDMFAVLLGGATSLLPVYAKDILHAGPSGLGLLQAALPAGALSCSVMLAHRPPIAKAGRTLLWAVTIFGLATIVFGISRSFALSMLMLYVCGASDNVSVIVRHTLVQLLTPDEKRGRVSAVNSLFIGTSNELGGFESGVVANWLGPVVSVVAGGVGTIVVVIAIALIWPQIRRYGALTGIPADA